MKRQGEGSAAGTVQGRLARNDAGFCSISCNQPRLEVEGISRGPRMSKYAHDGKGCALLGLWKSWVQLHGYESRGKLDNAWKMAERRGWSVVSTDGACQEWQSMRL